MMPIADLTERSTVLRLLSEAGVRPSKRLGQNFLVDRAALRRMVSAVEDAAPKEVLEIGAGFGTVTREIARLVSRVVAVEIDRRLIPFLREATVGLENVEVVHADILALDIAAFFPAGGAFVFGNIPYRITSPILEWLLEHRDAVQGALLLTQTEVAERIARSPGPEGSALGIAVQSRAQVSLIGHVARGAFVPVPEVDSTLWRLDVLPQLRFSAPPAVFQAVVRALYGKRRKMLRAALRDVLPAEDVLAALRAATVDGARRGETLSLDELDRLAWAVVATGRDRASSSLDKRAPPG